MVINMKLSIQTIIALMFLSSCGQRELRNDQDAIVNNKNQSELKSTNTIDDQIKKKKVGKELFKSILDTVTIKEITVELLINNKWLYNPFENCESYMKFQENGRGISYGCEMEEDYEMLYKIKENRVFVAEYDIPHVDNKERKKIKFRDDIYVYNGHSLILIDSKMYNIGGQEWIPKIDVLINYDMKKND
jgi:hypothetical protein